MLRLSTRAKPRMIKELTEEKSTLSDSSGILAEIKRRAWMRFAHL